MTSNKGRQQFGDMGWQAILIEILGVWIALRMQFFTGCRQHGCCSRYQE
jgi:hypothetical protein